MSSAMAMATVTLVLKQLLVNHLTAQNANTLVGGSFKVSALTPDLLSGSGTGSGESPGLNVFLYQVRPNLGWRNVGLPSRDDRGDRLTNPPLALDLYYLLSALGTNDLEAEVMLGMGMQLLHETPLLTRQAIRNVLATSANNLGISQGLLQALVASEVVDQIEPVKICQHFLEFEEMSQIWTAAQTAYRSSTAYHVSLVLIESRRSTRPALPVRQSNIYVMPFHQPLIEQVLAQPDANAASRDRPILAGYRLVLRGQRLRGEITRLRIGGVDLPDTGMQVSESEISFPLPTTLRAGVQGVQVVHQLPLGTPPTPHRGVESNIAAFVLQPTIKKNGNVYDITVQSPTVTNGLLNANLVVKLNPRVAKQQRVVLLLNRLNTPPDQVARAYSFVAPARADAETDTITFPIREVQPGDYLLRVQVDGAESPLDEAADKTYIGPRKTLP